MDLVRFWSACETLIGPAAVEAEWKQHAGDNYEAARVFLRPLQDPATSYPCSREPRCACCHRIVRHDDGSIVAVCRCQPRRCDTIQLAEADIVVYELNRTALFAAVADVMSLQPAQPDVPSLPWATRVGFDSPCAGYRFPVYLIITPRRDRLTSAVCSLTATNACPFIVIAPTNRQCEPGCLELLAARKSLFLTISDILSIDGSGVPAASEQCVRLLSEFHLAILPALQPNSAEANPVAFFATPPNAAWNDVHIRFLDGHTVSVSVSDKVGVYTYSQMGMSKRNSGTPTAQWKLLEAFAKGRGVFDWKSEHADRHQKKQKQLLAKALCEFFRIDGDPFRYVEELKGWEAHFDIEPSS